MLTQGLPGYNSLYSPCFSQHLLYEYVEVYLYIFLSFSGFLISKNQNLFLFSVRRDIIASLSKTDVMIH